MRGPVEISGGNVFLNGAASGIIVPGNSTADDNDLRVSITGGNVTIIADNPGAGYNGLGIQSPNIYINSDEYVNIYGKDIAVFSPQSVDGTDRTIQILAVGKGSVISNSEESPYNVVHVNGAGETTSDPTTTINPANYTEVDHAIDKANALIRDHYVDFSKVDEAVAGVDRNVTVLNQAKADAMAQAIEDAIAGLTYRPADYTKVDEAIDRAESLVPGDYTDFSAVNKAIAAVERGKNITEQEKVNAMAKAIDDAIMNLEKKQEAPAVSGDTDFKGTNSPEIGDNSNIIFWVVLVAAAGVVLTGTGYIFIREKEYSR